MIDSTLWKLVPISHHISIDIIFKDSNDQTNIDTVSNPSSIIDLCTKEIDNFVGYDIILI